MLSPVFSSQFKPALAPALQPVFALNKITQHLTKLSASAGSYGKTNIELKTGYRVEIVAQIKASPTTQWRWLLDSTSSPARSYLVFDNNSFYMQGFTDLLVDGVASTVAVNDDKIHTLSVVATQDTNLVSLFSRRDGIECTDQIAELVRVYDETDTLVVHLDFKQPPDTQFIPNLASSYIGRDYFNFNGVNQYIESSISISPGETLSLEFIAPSSVSGNFEFLIDSTDRSSFVVFRSDGTIGRSSAIGDLKLDGVAVVNNTTLYPTDGMAHTLSASAISNVTIEVIGAEYRKDRSYASFPIYNLVVGNGSLYNYPIDDGWANNPVIRNTGSGADATLINGTPLGWSAAQDGAEAVNIPTENYLPVTWDAERNAYKAQEPVFAGTYTWTGEESNYQSQGYAVLDAGLYEVMLDLTGGTHGKLKTQSQGSGVLPFKGFGQKYVSVYFNEGVTSGGQTQQDDGRYVGVSITEYRKFIEVAQ